MSVAHHAGEIQLFGHNRSLKGRDFRGGSLPGQDARQAISAVQAASLGDQRFRSRMQEPLDREGFDLGRP
jgi:hypothetical protein